MAFKKLMILGLVAVFAQLAGPGAFAEECAGVATGSYKDVKDLPTGSYKKGSAGGADTSCKSTEHEAVVGTDVYCVPN